MGVVSSGPAPALASGLVNLDLPAPSLEKLVYGRQHAWGDKLVRKLTPEQVQQYLAEQPFVNQLSSIAQSQTNFSYGGVAQSSFSRRIVLRRKFHMLAAKAAGHRAKAGEQQMTVATTDVSDDTYQRGNLWVVPGVGEFTNKTIYKFTGSVLPVGLTASDNVEQQGSAPFPFRFDTANVTVSDGTLNLKVPGGQNGRTKPISCAEVTTDETNIMHASVRMTAKMSAQPGVLALFRYHVKESATAYAPVVFTGAFFYRNDNAETDIEYLTDPSSKSNRSNPDTCQIWYSNQAISTAGQPAHESADPPPTVEGYHTYRLDWTSKFTAYYVDGKLQSKLTDNVPNKSGMWVWNNWSNGEPGWSCGPPKNDSVFRISDITMYYNTVNNQ